MNIFCMVSYKGRRFWSLICLIFFGNALISYIYFRSPRTLFVSLRRTRFSEDFVQNIKQLESPRNENGMKIPTTYMILWHQLGIGISCFILQVKFLRQAKFPLPSNLTRRPLTKVPTHIYQSLCSVVKGVLELNVGLLKDRAHAEDDSLKKKLE